jgi:salicylate hydroxylase
MSTTNGQKGKPFHVLIIGAGLGGLSCAISCLREGLTVTILEKAKELGEIGAGIQMPPNATRVMAHYGLVDKIEQAGAVRVPGQQLLDYKTGRVLIAKPGDEWQVKQFGHYWYVVHRADYHKVLLEDAIRRGAQIHLDCDAVEVDLAGSVRLANGKTHTADVVIGADGLRSFIRTSVLGRQVDPVDTGDMAFRMTIPRAQVARLNSPVWNRLLDDRAPRIWLGPLSHVICYPVRNGEVFNFVLCAPDDLPPYIPTAEADIGDMKAAMKGWDPNILQLMDCVERGLKWKICHMDELQTWTKGHVALLGDACHPTLPYQAQGAAMAVEDGAVLGILLGGLSKSGQRESIPEILHLYEDIRKKRTTTIVRGAVDNAHMFQMSDPQEMEQRNADLATVDLHDPNSSIKWIWANLGYQRDLLGFDTITVAQQKFAEWASQHHSKQIRAKI